MIIPIGSRTARYRSRLSPSHTSGNAEVPLDAAVLDDIAAGIAAAEPLWRSAVRHDAYQRSPVRLLSTAAYEVWVIGWMPDQAIELHDHGDSGGVFLVIEGVLTEIRAEESALVRDTLPAGSVRHLPLGLIHDIVNTSPDPATTIHVYSPPLRTMTHYDAVRLQALQTERVLPEPTVLTPAAGSAIFHPAAAASHA